MIELFCNFKFGDVFCSKELQVKTFKFSGGELQVKILNENNEIPYRTTITAHLHSSDDIMELLLVTNALRKLNSIMKIELICPYLPYARQDRVCSPGEAFSLEVMAQIINSQNYVSVIFCDVHSQTSLDLIHHSANEEFVVDYSLLYEMIGGQYRYIVAPDKGALERAKNFASYFDIVDILYAEKVRNPENGEILRTEVPNIQKIDGVFIMIDDICDGGRTFIELAKVLRPYTDEKIILVVTHGIFSKGFDVFKGLIDEIYVANLVNCNYDLPDFVHKM
jgi:ribose-phosphate pyrophosphokinase